MFAYSAKNNNIKDFLLYSILNPDTNSDSPSEKSNGVRLVSAKEETNHIINIKGIISDKFTYFWSFSIKLKLSCSVILITVKTISIKLIS